MARRKRRWTLSKQRAINRAQALNSKGPKSDWQAPRTVDEEIGDFIVVDTGLSVGRFDTYEDDNGNPTTGCRFEMVSSTMAGVTLNIPNTSHGSISAVDVAGSLESTSDSEKGPSHASDKDNTEVRYQQLRFSVTACPLDPPSTIDGTLVRASITTSFCRMSRLSNREEPRVRAMQLVNRSEDVELKARDCPREQVNTKQGAADDCYVEMAIQNGESCMIYGNSTALYYKPRKSFSTAQSLRQIPLWSTTSLHLPTLQIPISQLPSMRLPSFYHLIVGAPPAPPRLYL
ncbi:hypothetical protein B0O99DRAFT_694568 [Bisporella sp. PMI_857]|nr:hypothetical protein B0O99DRAFT_694568 [Bisporella sp. PMI_857]